MQNYSGLKKTDVSPFEKLWWESHTLLQSLYLLPLYRRNRIFSTTSSFIGSVTQTEYEYISNFACFIDIINILLRVFVCLQWFQNANIVYIIKYYEE